MPTRLPTSRPRAGRRLRWWWGLLVLPLLGWLGRRPLERAASGRAAAEIESRLEQRVGGEVELGELRLLDWERRAAPEGAPWWGGLHLELGVAALHWTPPEGAPVAALSIDGARFEVWPWGALEELPALDGLEVAGGRVELGAIGARVAAGGDEAPAAGETAAGETAAGETAAAGEIERVLGAFGQFQGYLDRPELGAALGAVERWFAPGAVAQLSGLSIEGAPLSLAGTVDITLAREESGARASVHTGLASGGEVDATLTGSGAGVERLQLGLEQFSLGPLWSAVAASGGPAEGVAEAARLAGGAMDLSLLVVPGAGQDGHWTASGSISQLAVEHPALGRFPLDADITTSFTLWVRPEAGAVEMSAGRVSVNGVPGTLEFGLADLNTDPRFRVQASLARVPFADLLRAVPPEMVRAARGVGIEGDFDLTVDVEGPFRRRAEWQGDFTTDWSRVHMIGPPEMDPLYGYREPFTYEVGSGDRVYRRVLGQGSHFAALASLPSWVPGAVVVREDAAFFSHQGFDESELHEAFRENLRRSGGRGASTITQQVAKNLFLDGERTLARKLQEALYAWRLERALHKRRILEIYLNIAHWGPELYGIRAAARHWFGIEPQELSPLQAAFLATLLPSPDRYHGYYHRAGPMTDGLRERLEQTLERMVTQGHLPASMRPQVPDRLEFLRCAGEALPAGLPQR